MLMINSCVHVCVCVRVWVSACIRVSKINLEDVVHITKSVAKDHVFKPG